MKKLVVTLVGASLAVAMMQAKAEDVGSGFDVSMNAGIVSNYLFRGISQSGNSGAMQGGMDIKHSSGAYVGTWMSSLGGWANVEQDLYAGYGYNVTPDTALDLHVIKYTYPGASTDDYIETHLGVTESNMLAKGDSATVGADYSGDVLGDGTTWNYSAAYSYPLPMDVSLSGTVGYYDFKKTDAGTKYWGSKEAYTYWNLGVSKKMVGITWSLSYNDTNLSGSDCLAGAGGIGGNKDSCSTQLVLSATKAL
jgi:uncharacterized protein (TIGR02001 family)